MEDIIKRMTPALFSAGPLRRRMRVMASTTDRLLREALKQAPGERARIVAELLATLEPDVPSERRSEREWVQEIERRARAALEGSTGLSWTEARDQVRSRLSRR